MQDAGFRIEDSGSRIQDPGFMKTGFGIQDSGFRMQDSGFKIHQDSGRRIQSEGLGIEFAGIDERIAHFTFPERSRGCFDCGAPHPSHFIQHHPHHTRIKFFDPRPLP